MRRLELRMGPYICSAQDQGSGAGASAKVTCGCGVKWTINKANWTGDDVKATFVTHLDVVHDYQDEV